MTLGQITHHGQLVAAVFEGGQARPIAGHTTASLVEQAEREGVALSQLAAKLASPTAVAAAPAIPITPTEVWGCGCTYERSAAFRDSEHNTREGFYHYVYQAEHRPEVFYKGAARHCVGPEQAIGLRADSQFTAPEPELAVVLGADGRIHGYTLANDVSAWDIERENPLYLPQSKTFTGCAALGPVIVTADELTDPYALEMTCTITRGSDTLFSGATTVGKLNRKLEVLVEYLLRSNPVPSGTVLMTGTGIIVTEEAALRPGDIVAITVPGIGTLRNPAAVV